MKFSVAKLKSLDYKKLALDHAEKFVGGIIVLVAALIVFMPLIGGTFTKYDKTPDQVLKKAEEEERNIQQSVWPEEQKLKYQSTGDLSRKIVEIKKPVQPSNYLASIEAAPPLYQKKEPRKEPEWARMTVEDPLVRPDRAYLQVPASDSSEGSPMDGAGGLPVAGADGTAVPLGGEDESEIPLKFRKRGAGGRGAAGPGLLPGSEGSGGYMGEAGPDVAGYGEAENGEAGMMGMMGMGSEGSGGAMAGVEGRGFRYSLITGVLNIRKQRELVAKALSIPEQELNAQTAAFDVLGFDIARKEGTGPWPKVEDDQILDKKRSMEILMQMLDFDIDPVGFGVTHQQITSPLPLRGVGEWDGEEVAHPRIQNYVDSSEEAKDLKSFLISYLAGQEEKKKALRDLVEKKNNLGFGEIQRNVRGAAQNVFSGGESGSGMEGLMSGYGAMAGAGNPMGNAGSGMLSATRKTQVKNEVSSITASGALLLFRYFDFDIEPGKTYQYRIRLIFENPNFNQAVSELANPDSRLGETRTSDWSDLTAPVTVPRDTQYFLTEVSDSPRKKDKAARVDMYQWNPENGTVTHGSLLESVVGQFIGGQASTDVLDVKKGGIEKQKVEFSSDDVLVDASKGISINLSEHADLKLPSQLKGRLRIADEALVLDLTGKLTSIDPVTSASNKRNARQMLEYQNKPWEDLKKEGEDSEGGGYGEGFENPYGGMGLGGEEGADGEKKKGSRRNRFRRKNKLKKDGGGMGGYGSSGGSGSGGN